MIRASKFFFGLLSSIAIASTSYGEAPAAKGKVIVPDKQIELFNGVDFTNWYTWMQDTGLEDLRQVFTIQKDGTLRISGDGFGGLTTNDHYADYHLVVEFRWGTETFAPRKTASRDSGVLLHCQGSDGNFGRSGDKLGPWMNSIECQIIEGGVGDILVLAGLEADGTVLPARATANVVRDRDGEIVWSPDGEEETFTSGRINWFGRDPDWKDVLGIRGANDVENPGQEWNRLECYCSGDSVVYVLNGVVVNRAKDLIPSSGKILVQTEGAEMFVRKVQLNPLPAEIP
ncbi:3-keto-disaccharide hydrolase [Planctomicrobium sp. SH668]|uniref:3-keto-disaccharide hydrolase n=1 Tax=Planctomicrobium sp. SH668 TaxID=3448126 RepID=UPI003F5B14FF